MYSATAVVTVASIFVSNSGYDLGTTSIGVVDFCVGVAATFVDWTGVLVGRIGAGIDVFVSWGGEIEDDLGGVAGEVATGIESNFDFIVEVIGGIESASVKLITNMS